LFGTGLIQSGQYASIYNGSVDNIFLAVLLHAGLFGFSLYMLIMANLWSHCLEIVRRTNDIFPLSCIAVFSTWMILGVFTIQPTGFPLIFIFALVSSGIYTAKQRITIEKPNARFVAAG
jgi:cell division protein FtsW (lipid II flippase)